ncbi:Olfactory receptor 13C2 [Collichthys lucidus]|uniref:Olfactory receptor n=1 Tax=Collichthys lucidus TaxID=240159 RepID=A0A4U5U1M7_COLLU|nr:Olfactory receptor 13C2 [Collichthys lucidus]
MDDEFNVTYITLDGYVDVHKYRYLYFVIMFTAYILILCSNSTVVYLIWIHPNLHEPMYIFIAALLLNSVLFSMTIYPKLLIDFLSEKQIITYSACVFQSFFYYSLGGSEFLLLAAMSYDRFVSICKPLQYPTIMNKTTISIVLVLAWLVPAVHIAVPAILNANKKLCRFTFKGIICNSTVFKLHCVTSRGDSIYGVIIMFNVTLLPLLFILFTYTRIFIISYRSGRDVRKKAAETCLPHLLVLIIFFCLSTCTILLLLVESDFSKTVRFIMILQIIVYHPLFNPIIYGLKMKEISKHLRRLFHMSKLT